MFEKIARHVLHAFNSQVIISTVKLAEGLFETIVMFDDGEELDCVHAHTREDACTLHENAVLHWTSIIYDGSIDKCIGIGSPMESIKPA